MPRRRLPLLFLTCTVICVTAGARAAEPVEGAAPAGASAARPTRYAESLARECDDLLRDVIKRSYGWGWTESGGDDEGPRKSPKTIIADPPGSASAGLLLWYSGELLQNPGYTAAARQVARGTAASQLPSGRVVSTPVFYPTSVQRHEVPSPVPDRAATRAALALLLTVAEGRDKDPDYDPLRRAGAQAARYLLKQQADTGAWPIAYPPGAPPAKQSRVTRLDTPDFRDSTFALLFAYEVLGDPMLRRAAEKSFEFLDRARNPESARSGGSLWGAAFTLGGSPVDKIAEFPERTDLLASRYALQTLLGLYADLGQGPVFVRAQRAAASLQALPRPADPSRWYRYYTPRGEPVRSIAPAAPTTAPATTRPAPLPRDPAPKGPPIFDVPPPAEDDPALSGDYDLPASLQLVETIVKGKRQPLIDRLKPLVTPKRLLAQTAAGLGDGNFPADFPGTADEVPLYLERYAATFAPLSQPPAQELSARLRRLWAIYWRAVIEARCGA